LAHDDGHRGNVDSDGGRGSESDETTLGWPAIGMVEAMLDGKTTRPFGINDLDFPNGRAVSPRTPRSTSPPSTPLWAVAGLWGGR
jgi:hypothetical protein